MRSEPQTRRENEREVEDQVKVVLVKVVGVVKVVIVKVVKVKVKVESV